LLWGTDLEENSAPTIEDVAREAGVSTATVSRTLNSPESVVKQTRLRVLAAVKALDYSPNFGARALAARRTNTIGAVIPTIENAIFAQGLQAFQETIAKAGSTLLVASSSYQQDIEEEQIRTLVARGADAILLIGEHRSDEIYAFLQKRHIPYVISWYYRSDTSHCYVGFENRSSANEIAKSVLELGHSKIGMIAGLTKNNDRARERVMGVRDAIVEYNITEDSFNVIEAPYSFIDGGDAFEILLSKDEPPTAVICGNDVLAVGALKRAKSMGLRIPQDISITGFDDIEVATMVEPELTTVHVPHRRMGRIAAECLLAMRKKQQQPQSHRLKPYIVRRGTLSKPGE
jgi:LacI family transcriptional regulator